MSASINWLHITDLHIGVHDDSWLWPTIKHELFRDLETLRSDVGQWDLVFFTGDLTQSGSDAEFRRLERDLEELWGVLSKSGAPPRLCVVPGNHDLARPNADSPAAKTIAKLWWGEDGIRANFWRDKDTEYHIAIQDYFGAYMSWLASSSIPRLSESAGLLPGDFSATFVKDDAQLGIVGLNSSFLQITSGNYEKLLDIHARQLNAVCDGDPSRWTNQRDATLLLTHHPPMWLSDVAQAHFRQEVHPPGRFLAHFCGHQHEPQMFDSREAGAPTRRLRQGPSLLGLEHWEDSSAQNRKRIHGYNCGQFTFENGRILEKIWPRIAIKGRHGGMNLRPDHTFVLANDCVTTSIERESDVPDRAPPPVEAKQLVSEVDSLQLLSAVVDANTIKANLAALPRLTTQASPQHKAIRQAEQSELEVHLRRSRVAWIKSDWGMGTVEFLAASLSRFNQKDTPVDIFHLRCEDASDSETIESLFGQQFGMTLPTFCSQIANAHNAFLFLDDVSPETTSPSESQRLRKLLDVVLDYCPNLAVVFASRVGPPEGTFPVVELRALDVPDVRSYLESSPGISELPNPETIELIHERADGLTLHIDRIVRALNVSSLKTVLSTEIVDERTDASEASKALSRTVLSLSTATEKQVRRSFSMLKVLSILSYGETMESLKHYLAAEPFFESNALQLRELGLLDVIHLRTSSARQVTNVTDKRIPSTLDAPKLLRVPRQVRDYVLTTISEDEASDLTTIGMELFFGRRWHEGVIKARRLPPEHQQYLGASIGNEFALLKRLLSSRGTRPGRARKAAFLSAQYARRLSEEDRYRDLAIVAAALQERVRQEDHLADWSELGIYRAKGLRMTGNYPEALKYSHAVLNANDQQLSKNDEASCWLNIALCHESLGESDDAVLAAEKVIEAADAGSGQYIQAQTIIAEARSSQRDRRLAALEKEARTSKLIVAANNIALTLAATGPTHTRLKHLERVLFSEGDPYNHVRAIVTKATLLQQEGRGDELKTTDLTMLAAAYAYLHTQRLHRLFDQCHEALWLVFTRDPTADRLLVLFRHASFLWRIRGEDSKEAAYLSRLKEHGDVPKEGASPRGMLLEVRYYFQRIRSLLQISQKA
jgi:tetratricopeptide (TPR) repeat protein